ncbi:hypothetical protein ATO11_05485 [Pseudaestuariivita atlantica]|uniref:DUF11 domain-containing protein n=2 Tax=Pseudaestuariivita atlantica TaxID=1317121 RepID=A0A0L1JT05_9RHOB|nr:hypothetical protein ATO11_05485 [Pseudaestuariivita atlantica]
MNGSSVMRSFDRLIDYNTAQLGAQSGSQHFIVDPDPGIQPSTYAAFGSGSLDLYAVICLSTPPITLTKTLTSPVPILAPTNVTFELAPVLTNTALFEGRTLAVTDTLPAGLTYTSATGTDWACSASGQVVTCIYTVPTGGGAVTQVPPVTLTAQVDAAMASGDYSNCAVLSDPESAPTDPAAIWLPLELATAPACADMPVRHLVDRYHYAVKYVCGAQDNDAEPEAATTLAQGRYFTEINILNPGYLAADLEKRVYPLTLDTTDVYREPAQTPATGGEDMTLNPGHATFDDCLKLGEMLGADDLAEKRASIGWLSITSPHPLDVTAVYTGRDIDRDNATSIDVEQVSGRVVQIAQ